jgi:hypothetical protein
MGWNTDVFLIKDGHNRRLADLVPDVLAPRYQFLGFEDASSVRFDDVISAGVIPGWGIVVDGGMRLRRSPTYQAEVSAGTMALLVHIADEPMIRRYVDGQLVSEATGVAACRAHLVSALPQFKDLDYGEVLAHALIGQELGSDLIDATAYVGFTVFELI